MPDFNKPEHDELLVPETAQETDRKTELTTDADEAPLSEPDKSKQPVEPYFGGCPLCGDTDGYMNIGTQEGRPSFWLASWSWRPRTRASLARKMARCPSMSW